MSEVKRSVLNPQRRERLADIAAFGLIGLYNLFFFFSIWSGAASFWFRDVITNYLPIKIFLRGEFLNDRWPLWTDRLYNGFPVWGDPVNAILYPGQIFLLLFDDPVFAYGMLTVLHFALAQAGFFLWLKGTGVSRSAAFLGSLALVYGGVFLNTHAALQFLYAWTWVGWYLAALDSYLSRPRFPAGLLAVLSYLCITLSGELQTVAILGGITFIIAAVIPRQGVPIRRRLAAAIPIPLITALIAAPFLLPAYELSAHSTRAAVNTFEAVTEWSLHPFRWIELVIPGIFGVPYDEPLWWADGLRRSSFWGFYTPTIFAGTATLLCGAFSLSRPQDRRLNLWLGIGLVSFVAACGDWLPFYRLLYEWVPLWKMFKFPERLLFWTAIGASLCAAKGLDHLFDHRFKWLPALLAVIVAVAIFSAGVLTQDLSPWIRTISGHQAVNNGQATAAAAFRLSFHIWLGTALIFALAASAARNYSGWIVVSATAGLLFFVNRPYVPAMDVAVFRSTPTLAAALINEHPEAAEHAVVPLRISPDQFVRDLQLPYLQRLGSGAAGFSWNTLHGNSTLISPWSDSLGYNSSQLITQQGMVENTSIAAYAALTGTRYLALTPDIASKNRRWKCGELVPGTGDPGLEWCENDAVFPPVRCPLGWQRMDKIDDLRNRFARTFFVQTGSNFAYLGSFDEGLPLPPEKTSGVSSGKSDSARNCQVVSWDPEEKSVGVESDTAGPVILRDLNYPGWSAYIDGLPATVITANGGLLAAWVPAGKHDVRFVFEPVSIRIGFAIAAVTVLAAFFLFVFPDLKRRSS